MDTSNIRFLVVDDFSTMRRIVRNLLKEIGHSNVDEAEDGQAALSKLKANAFDFVVSDINMPNMNGLQLVQHLREMKYPGKILVFSSELKPQIAEAYLALGVDRVLPKPIFPSELRRILDEL